MILNKRFPQVIDGNITYNTISRYFEIFDFNTEIPYWHIEVGDIHSLTDSVLDQIIPDSILKLLRAKTVTLVIVNAFEGMHNVLETVYENLVIKRNIPEDSIVFFSESFTIHDAVSKCQVKYNRGPIKVFIPLVSEFSTSQYLRNSKISNIKVDRKRFICLNRRWRPHRPTLVAMLYARGVLDEGYVSLISTEKENWGRTVDWIIDLNIKNDILVETLKESRDSILTLPNLTVDLNDLEDYSNIGGLKNYTYPFYNSTYFSLVTETYFYAESPDNGICITEKIFRPMCYHHPFIVLARPKFLETIRSLGYQTFNGIFDESYDLEEDDATRMLMIVNEIERLCRMPIEELESLISKCRPICEHNYKVLLSKASQPKKKLDI
jgi:hypothetical protein